MSKRIRSLFEIYFSICPLYASYQSVYLADAMFPHMFYSEIIGQGTRKQATGSQPPLARVHYEAMAAGLPIVTTARGGNPEVILANENGLIVENPENPSDFADKIAQILSNTSLMKRMGEKGRELAVSLYHWERVASELLEVWEQAKEFESTAALTTELQTEEAFGQPVSPQTNPKETERSKKNTAARTMPPKTEKANVKNEKRKKKRAASLADDQQSAKQKEAMASQTESAKGAPAPPERANRPPFETFYYCKRQPTDARLGDKNAFEPQTGSSKT
ncbi:D-inositol-3-phosphate glycosyltransferase [Geobacillus stearothermophilus ATCC 7953]